MVYRLDLPCLFRHGIQLFLAENITKHWSYTKKSSPHSNSFWPARVEDIGGENEKIKDILKSVILLYEAQTASQKHEIKIDCPEDLGAQANIPLLEQALINLIGNAVKYSEPGKVIAVEAERSGTEVVVRVRDQGGGIESQHLSRIFERFYRVDKARSRELGGTGLGLAIVKHIAQAHSGSVSVESTPGQGSVFTLKLPSLE